MLLCMVTHLQPAHTVAIWMSFLDVVSNAGLQAFSLSISSISLSITSSLKISLSLSCFITLLWINYITTCITLLGEIKSTLNFVIQLKINGKFHGHFKKHLTHTHTFSAYPKTKNQSVCIAGCNLLGVVTLKCTMPTFLNKPWLLYLINTGQTALVIYVGNNTYMIPTHACVEFLP